MYCIRYYKRLYYYITSYILITARFIIYKYIYIVTKYIIKYKYN